MKKFILSQDNSNGIDITIKLNKCLIKNSIQIKKIKDK